MYLLVVVLILLVLAIYGIKERLTPPTPPIDDLDAHLKPLIQMDSQKERQKYLKSRKWQRSNIDGKSNLHAGGSEKEKEKEK